MCEVQISAISMVYCSHLTHIQRQAALHDCLPKLLGDEDTNIKIVYGEEKNILYWADQSSQGRIKVSCTGATSQTNQPREHPFRPLVPISLVSTVSRGHSSVVYLVRTFCYQYVLLFAHCLN